MRVAGVNKIFALCLLLCKEKDEDTMLKFLANTTRFPLTGNVIRIHFVRGAQIFVCSHQQRYLSARRRQHPTQ